ncbi:uncharacterized protein LOC127873459 isoform X2 [Dreissena polymorpha]|nr:uncharacterized protein LOC127873459 isoform X2 [Dreissena polymorpha]
MDRSLKILKQKHTATLRLRRVNEVHNRLLEDKIRVLNTKFIRESKELLKVTRSLKEEMEEYEPTRLPDRLPRIESAALIESRSSSRQSGRFQNGRQGGIPRDQICQSCLFDSTNTTLRCRHFPCFLPMTYNSLSVLPKPQTYSVVSNYKQLLSRCKDLRPPTSPNKHRQVLEFIEEMPIEESRAPRTTVREKLRGLKLLVKEMKERNEKTKPRDWAINYGEPMPRRLLSKPVKTVC